MNLQIYPLWAQIALIGLALLGGAGAILLWRRRPGLAVALGVVGGAATLLLGLWALVWFVVPPPASSGSAYNEWRWVVSAPLGRFGIILASLVSAATVILAWRGTARERQGFRRALLVALRAGACLAALALFVQPALELRHVTREPNHIAVLVDDSRSMELAEQPGGETRAARAAKLIAASGDAFARWRRQHRVDFYSFADLITPQTEARLASVPAGVQRADATLMREALEAVRARYEGSDLAGVVIVSDGVATGRWSEGAGDGGSQELLSGMGARVHTAWAGRAGLVDLAVSRVEADEFAFVRTAVELDAVIRATGLPGQDVTVTLRAGGQVVASEIVRIGGGTGEARVRFEIVPERVGKYVYEFSVPELEGESITGNNRRAVVLRVIRDKIRVLQVAGRPSWDERALRGFFKADPNVDLISFFILRTPDDIQAVASDEMSLIPFPTRELFEDELGSFDVILLQNFDYGRYGIAPYLENIRAYVERGGALAMIGGDLSFSSGGYPGTAVADALPVELIASQGDDGRLLSIDEFRPRLTAEGQSHPLTQLRFDRRDNLSRWEALPPLEGLNLVAGLKPGATALAEHPTLRGRGGRHLPVIATGEYGKGRVAAFMTDSFWRWGLVAAGRNADEGRSYAKLWENSVRWLIRDPDLEYLHVESDQAEYAPGVSPRLRARLVDKDYRPAPKAQLSLAVLRLAGSKGATAGAASDETVHEVKRDTDESGEVRLDLGDLPPGAYRVVAQARLGDRQVTADDVFLINPERQELERPAAREDLLQIISKATGGKYLGAASQLPADLDFAEPRVVRVDRRVDVELWSRPALLIVALGFLGLEWALRRRRGFL